MNKALHSTRLKALYNPSPYLEYYEDLEILTNNLLFTAAFPLLFDILLYNDRIVDLCIDDYASICLDKVTDRVHEAR